MFIAMRVAVSLGEQQIGSGVLGAAQNLSVISGANCAVIQAEAQNLRWRDDGVAPTASVGQLILTGTNGLEYFGDLTKIQIIAAQAGGICNVTQARVVAP